MNFTGQEVMKVAPFGSFFGGIGMLKHQHKHSLGRILNRNAEWSYVSVASSFVFS